MNKVSEIFSNKQIIKNYERAEKEIEEHSFLIDAAAHNFKEHIQDMQASYESFCNVGYLPKQHFIELESLANSTISENLSINRSLIDGLNSPSDNPLPEKKYDILASIFLLHKINDLTGALIKIRKSLKKDGVFLGAIFGADTLLDFRKVIAQAETEIYSCVSPRIIPFIDIKTLGSLLQRAGFAQPVLFTDNIKVSYDNVTELMLDIRAMGESGLLLQKGKPLTRTLINKIDDLYKKQFSDGSDGIIVNFDVINITAFAS